ncbi:LacI family transcriptional regulator [Thermomicrobium sp. CFH 73360]|uniref:LacI family DNA-binding transcriptional regulator n=1 Tax=Thermomicrobium sp. CFH 73360 TaxID=2951987 RepID=UPI0020773DE7|nr:LacI family DNA-binding transcriptional regulator [Thermomicrobium sp. CFH 73360]MCM8747161.1 LacI family transcriptional regulator [Thermomicrobium sp. CFH 73360]
MAKRSGSSQVTIRDVAGLADVGVATVSRLPNGDPAVAAATREWVHAVMAELGDEPLRAARALLRRRTDALLVVLPLWTRCFSVQILCGIEEALLETNDAFILRTLERPADGSRTIASVRRDLVDGVLLASLVVRPLRLARLERERWSAVVADGDPAVPLSLIVVDHVEGARLAVTHVARSGHRRMAAIDRPGDPFADKQRSRRLLGDRQALQELGPERRAEYERVTPFRVEGGITGLHSLMQLPVPPTAIVVGRETHAGSVLRAVRQLGLDVPRDLAGVGYHESEIAELLGLTTVHCPRRAIGRQAAQLLLDSFSGRLAPNEVAVGWVTPNLMVRRSCGAQGTEPGAGSVGE